jgi:hypothetical protein
VVVYISLIFIVFFLAFRYIKPLQINFINPWVTPITYTLKVLVGFSFIYIYTEVYGDGHLSADAGAFMNESATLNQVFYDSPINYLRLLVDKGDTDLLTHQYLGETSHWASGAQAIISENRNIMRVHSLIHFFSFGNAIVHLLVMCFLSLLGFKYLFEVLKERTQLNPTYLFLILLIFPSLLFWSSSILKEPIVLLGMGLFVRGILGKETLKKRWIIGILGALIILAFKSYILIAIIPAFIFYWGYKLMPKFKIISSLSLLVLITLGAVLVFPTKRDHVVHLFSRKQFDFKNVGQGGLHAHTDSCFYFFEGDQLDELIIEGDFVSIDKEISAYKVQLGAMDKPRPIVLQPTGEKWPIYFQNRRSDGYIELTLIDDSFVQMIKNIPEALQNSLIRPFPNDPGSGIKYIAIVEMILLYLLFIYGIIKRRKINNEGWAIIISISIFVLSLALIIGWITPVLGAIVRYRIPAFLGILIISILMIQVPQKRGMNNSFLQRYLK